MNDLQQVAFSLILEEIHDELKIQLEQFIFTPSFFSPSLWFESPKRDWIEKITTLSKLNPDYAFRIIFDRFYSMEESIFASRSVKPINVIELNLLLYFLKIIPAKGYQRELDTQLETILKNLVIFIHADKTNPYIPILSKFIKNFVKCGANLVPKLMMDALEQKKKANIGHLLMSLTFLVKSLPTFRCFIGAIAQIYKVIVNDLKDPLINSITQIITKFFLCGPGDYQEVLKSKSCRQLQLLVNYVFQKQSPDNLVFLSALLAFCPNKSSAKSVRKYVFDTIKSKRLKIKDTIALSFLELYQATVFCPTCQFTSKFNKIKEDIEVFIFDNQPEHKLLKRFLPRYLALETLQQKSKVLTYCIKPERKTVYKTSLCKCIKLIFNGYLGRKTVRPDIFSKICKLIQTKDFEHTELMVSFCRLFKESNKIALLMPDALEHVFDLAAEIITKFVKLSEKAAIASVRLFHILFEAPKSAINCPNLAEIQARFVYSFKICAASLVEQNHPFLVHIGVLVHKFVLWLKETALEENFEKILPTIAETLFYLLITVNNAGLETTNLILEDIANQMNVKFHYHWPITNSDCVKAVIQGIFLFWLQLIQKITNNHNLNILGANPITFQPNIKNVIRITSFLCKYEHQFTDETHPSLGEVTKGKHFFNTLLKFMKETNSYLNLFLKQFKAFDEETAGNFLTSVLKKLQDNQLNLTQFNNLLILLTSMSCNEKFIGKHFKIFEDIARLFICYIQFNSELQSDDVFIINACIYIQSIYPKPSDGYSRYLVLTSLMSITYQAFLTKNQAFQSLYQTVTSLLAGYKINICPENVNEYDKIKESKKRIRLLVEYLHYFYDKSQDKILLRSTIAALENILYWNFDIAWDIYLTIAVDSKGTKESFRLKLEGIFVRVLPKITYPKREEIPIKDSRVFYESYLDSHPEVFEKMFNEMCNNPNNKAFFIALFDLLAQDYIPISGETKFCPPLIFTYYLKKYCLITNTEIKNALEEFYLNPMLKNHQISKLPSTDKYLRSVEIQRIPQCVFHSKKYEESSKIYLSFSESNRSLADVYDGNYDSAEYKMMVESQFIFCIDRDRSGLNYLIDYNRIPRIENTTMTSFLSAHFNNKEVNVFIDIKAINPSLVTILISILPPVLHIYLINVSYDAFILFNSMKKISEKVTMLSNLTQFSHLIFPKYKPKPFFTYQCKYKKYDAFFHIYDDEVSIIGDNAPFNETINYSDITDINITPISLLINTKYDKIFEIMYDCPDGVKFGLSQIQQLHKFEKPIEPSHNTDIHASLTALSLLDIAQTKEFRSLSANSLFNVLHERLSKCQTYEGFAIPTAVCNEQNVIPILLKQLQKQSHKLNQFSDFIVNFLCSESSSGFELSEVCLLLFSLMQTTKQIQLVTIWSVVKSYKFTRIAITNILTRLSSVQLQIELLACLSINNKQAIIDILIKELMYDNMISTPAYEQLFSTEYYEIFPFLASLGNVPHILFYSILIICTMIKRKAKHFEDAVIVINKEPIDFASLEIHQILDLGKSISMKQNEEFQQEYDSLFESLSYERTPLFWYFKPNMGPEEIILLMNESIENRIYIEKLVFSFHLAIEFVKNDRSKDMTSVCFFWTVLPFIQSEYTKLRSNAIILMDYILTFVTESLESSILLISNMYSQNEKLSKEIDQVGESIHVNYKNNICHAITTYMILSMLDDSSTELTKSFYKHAYTSLYDNHREASMYFALPLLTFSDDQNEEQITYDLCDNLKEKDTEHVIWMIKFIYWCITEKFALNRFEMFLSMLLQIFQARRDVLMKVKDDISKTFLTFMENPDFSTTSKEYISKILIFASMCNTSENPIDLKSPFLCILNESQTKQHTEVFFKATKELITQTIHTNS